jgi:[NiFe] hydrogenase diaphorase moiety large subunit
VILTEQPDLVFEGMTIAAYAVGANEGILYLRAEYAYLRAFLESVLESRRQAGLLGHDIGGAAGFSFDVRIQLGAGAYICGEETALINSCEGVRGDPRNRPPFPVERGYLGRPTVVNNVETLCCAARILEHGGAWFGSLGTTDSTGTKALSISGDCRLPGVYELPFGIRLRELLQMVDADDPGIVHVGGSSGRLVSMAELDRAISFEDLSTGGSIMVWNRQRDPLEIVLAAVDFSCEESCGFCVPCRVGNPLLRERITHIIAGRGRKTDLAYLESLCATVKATSRCGLGQSSPNPVESSLRSFRREYERRLLADESGLATSFDVRQALLSHEGVAGRTSVHFDQQEKTS